jgi:IS30 family transposase
MKKKLTDEEVREIRQLKKTGWTNKELAFRFGVAAPTVSRILNRRRRAKTR